MLNLKIITVGKLKEKAFVELEQEYLKRLRSFAKFSTVEIVDEPHTDEVSAEKARKKEADKILKQIKKGSFIVALSEKGKTITTLQFSTLLKPYNQSGQEINFIIGGSTGLKESVLKKANFVLSLSPLTFTHNFARVFLAEQLYRAATILAGKKYHY